MSQIDIWDRCDTHTLTDTCDTHALMSHIDIWGTCDTHTLMWVPYVSFKHNTHITLTHGCHTLTYTHTLTYDTHTLMCARGNVYGSYVCTIVQRCVYGQMYRYVCMGIYQHRGSMCECHMYAHINRYINYKSLLHNIVSFVGLFYKRDL